MMERPVLGADVRRYPAFIALFFTVFCLLLLVFRVLTVLPAHADCFIATIICFLVIDFERLLKGQQGVKMAKC